MKFSEYAELKEAQGPGQDYFRYGRTATQGPQAATVRGNMADNSKKIEQINAIDKMISDISWRLSTLKVAFPSMSSERAFLALKDAWAFDSKRFFQPLYQGQDDEEDIDFPGTGR